QFIAFLDRKLRERGVRKVVPTGEALTAACHRALSRQFINARLPRLAEQGAAWAQKQEVPGDLEERVRQRPQRSPELPWDEALAEVVAEMTAPASRRAAA